MSTPTLPFRRCSPVLVLPFLLPLGASAQADWCEDGGWRDAETVCEVREFTLSARSLAVDPGQNGGIEIIGEDRRDVRVLARVRSHARTVDDAEAILRDVEVVAEGGRVEAQGPRTDRKHAWSVSLRILVPRSTDLDLRTYNGGIGVEGVDGEVRMEALNGGIHLADMAGDVRGHTQNGGLHVELTGMSWDGAGLDVTTTNGGVTLRIPDGYSADLETGTVNGGMDLEFPLTLSGRIGRRIRTQLGNGGPPIHVSTTNGGVRIASR